MNALNVCLKYYESQMSQHRSESTNTLLKNKPLFLFKSLRVEEGESSHASARKKHSYIKLTSL